MPGPGDAVAKLNRLMEAVYSPILGMARAKKLPVIDLPRTFDIYRDELYVHQIEPSTKGGVVIAALIRHVVENDTPEKPSTLYTYSPCIPNVGAVAEEANEGQWLIPHDPSLVPSGQDVAFSPVEKKVMALVGMGIDRGTAEAALVRHGGALQDAVNELLAS
eukprot:gnl/TRDRNA2_/TRDRNA2_73503_c0_seq1.p1 gnl/TRDRNA2_/TRDRNA2_73503_c0~~gnl/TRDRNA2_/TRDRNA2_73503_c0_seq1.p1  ORF type:complete len:173 (+),score=23.87 gnl/TRDRNA2_/TRDRNA2_73503_c0_seq1:36-521(+)